MSFCFFLLCFSTAEYRFVFGIPVSSSDPAHSTTSVSTDSGCCSSGCHLSLRGGEGKEGRGGEGGEESGR